MKKTALILFALLLTASLAWADDASLSSLIALLPTGFNINQATVYSFRDKAPKENSVVRFISFINTTAHPEGYFHIDLGYIPPAEPTIGFDLQLIDLGKWIQFPVIKYVVFNPYGYYGMKDVGGANREDYGAGAIFFQIKK